MGLETSINENKLSIKNVTKKFGNFTALDNINLELNAGIYGLLGDNGAGKTTLMRIISTVHKPTSGNVYWCGEDIFKMNEVYRDLIGYIPQDFKIHPDFTGYEYLEYMGGLKGLSKSHCKNKIDEVLCLVNLEDSKNKKAINYSGGMKRRLGIAQALLNDPKILIFDEPTAGLDPNERIRFSNIIVDMSKDKIILFSTHIISDIEAITSRVIIINKGQIIANSEVSQLVELMKGRVFEIEIPIHELESFREKVKIVRIKYNDETLIIRYIGDIEKEAISIDANLEDYYILKEVIKNEQYIKI